MKNSKKKKLITILVLFVILLFGNMKSCQALIGDRIVGYKGLVSDFDKNSNNTNVGNKFILLENQASLNSVLNVKKDGDANISKKKVSDIISDMINLAWSSRERSRGISVTAGEIQQINDTFGFSYPVKDTKLTAEQKKAIIYKITSTDKMYFVQKPSSTFGAGTEMYCIQHDAGVLPLDYQIKEFVQIKGNQLTRYHKEDGDPTESASRSNANAILTYILNRTYNDYTYGFDSGARQYAVRHYLNTWIDSVGNGIGIDDTWKYNTELDADYYKTHQDWVTDGRQLITNATNYAPSYNKRATATLSEKSVTIDKLTNEIPVTLTYSGDLSITVKDTSGKEISSSNLVFKQGGKNVTVKNIESGTQFTIKNNSSQIIKTIDFNVTNNGVLCANLWFAKTTGYLRQYNIYDENGNQKNESQRFMIVKHYTEGTKASNQLNVSYKKGDIKITKVDADNTNTKLENAEFILKKSNGKWLSTSNGSYSDTTDKNSAQVFKTDSNGVASITNLPDDTYTIYEKTTPDGYEKDLQNGYNTNDDLINCGNITVSIGTTATKTVTNKKYGTITITKKDEINNNALQAGFKIHVGQFKFIGLGSNGEWTYNSTFENAYVFETGKADSNCKWTTVSAGSITIRKLQLNQTYGIWEVKAPNGYDLSKQSGYTTVTDDKNDIGKQYNYVYHGNTTLNSNKLSAKFEVTNLKYISIKGYVWVDRQVGKNNVSNSLYDTGESRVAGVTVNLVNKATKDVIATTKTETNANANGEYIFNNLVPENDIDSYYVEFVYNGVKANVSNVEDNEQEEDISKYIPVALNVTAANGSKAIMNSVATKDTDLSGIATTYAGTDATVVGNYGLAKCGTLSNGVLSNINLGIKKLKVPEYKISQNLYYVKIDINGFTFTYDYGKLGDNSMTLAPTANWQKPTSIKSYTADIYPSDIAYSIAQTDDKKRIKVYVVYKIDITNTANYNIEELYMEKEKGLKITSLKNYYDGNRYTIEKNYGSDSNPDFGKWSNESDGKRNGKDVKVVEFNMDKYKDGIDYKDGSNTITSFIEFRVKDDAINKILENPKGIVEEYPTVAEANGYHEYQRKDYSWENNITKVQDHETTNDIRSSAAPYLVFKENIERTIKGQVFEDGIVTNDGQKLGNGLYDNNENLVGGIEVDLIEEPSGVTDLRELSADAIKSLQPATRYPKTNESNGGKPQPTNNTVITDKGGNYNLVGVVPGRYFLRFTYGDGSQKIYTTNGEEVKTIVGKDYKSTRVTEENAKSALNGGTKERWYKDIKNVIASVALDNLNTRKMANEATNGIYDVMAGTAKMSITIENNDNDNDNDTFDMPKNDSNEPKQETLADSKDTKETIYANYVNAVKARNTFDGLSFGIIEVPKQKLEIQKLITNVTLVSDGNILYNGNPENVPSQGVVALSDLDNKENGGSTYVRAEMQETRLYGTNIELTYEVKITNKSDINYYNDGYYWFGKAEENKEVTLTPIDVKDYLDETLNYVKEKSDQARIDEVNKNATIQVDGKNIKAQELKLKGWKALYTDKITNRDNNHQISDKVKIVANRILSNNDSDMEIVSRAEIKEVSRTPDSNDTDTQKMEKVKVAPTEVHTNGMVEALFTITPPTGENRSVTTIYAIAGIISLIILSTGIVIIKKKVI